VGESFFAATDESKFFWPSSRSSSSAFYPLLRHLLRLATTGLPTAGGPQRAPQRRLGRPARSRPATGDVTATDRYVLLRVVFRPSGAKKGLRASAGALADLPLFSDKQWHCSPCGSPAKSGRQKPSTRLVMTLPKRFFDDDTSEARSTSTLSAAGDRQPMASSAKICADPLDRRVASVQGVHRPGHLLQLALVGLYWQ
jgi:hypothetical protein